MAINAKKRLRIFRRDNFVCQICKSNKELTIDHIIPISQEGTDIETNLRTLCEKCNKERGNYTPSFFDKVMYLIFTRKDANRLKNEIFGTVASRDVILKNQINQKLEEFSKSVRSQLSTNDAAPNKTETAIQIVGIKNTVSAYKDQSFARDDKLLNIIYLMAEKLEELESKVN